jgi:DNA-directed RNA polymerase, sigma subunit (sigma70/sigma32)
LDDLISAGKLGLCKAAERYDPAKAKFSTYAGYWIKKYIFEEQRKFYAASLSKPIGDGIILEDAVADKEAQRASRLLSIQGSIEEVRRALMDAGLDDREMAIMSQRHGLDDGQLKTQKQIAKKLGLTRQRIGQIEKIARGKIGAYTGKKNRV